MENSRSDTTPGTVLLLYPCTPVTYSIVQVHSYCIVALTGVTMHINDLSNKEGTRISIRQNSF